MNARFQLATEQARAFLAGPIARGSISSVAIRIAGLAIAFLQSVLAARILGVDGYGLTASVIAFAQLGAVLVLFGGSDFAIRECARLKAIGRTELLKPFLYKLVFLTVSLSIVLSGTIFLIALVSPTLVEGSEVLALVGLLIVPALALIRLLRGFAQGVGAVWTAQWPGEILRPGLIVAALLVALVLQQPMDAQSYLWTFLAAAAVSLIAALASAFSQATVPAGVAAEYALPNKALFPFFGLSLIAMVQTEFATLALTLLSDAFQTGLYQPVGKFALLLSVPATAAAMRYAPRVTELYTLGEHDRLRAITHTYTAATTLLTAFCALVLGFGAPWLLMLFGPDFTATAPIVWIVASSFVFNVACGPVGYLLTMVGKAGAVVVARIIGLAVSLVAALLLVPGLGAEGAAWALAAGMIAWNGVALAMVLRILAFDPSIFGFFGSRLRS